MRLAAPGVQRAVGDRACVAVLLLADCALVSLVFQYFSRISELLLGIKAVVTVARLL